MFFNYPFILILFMLILSCERGDRGGISFKPNVTEPLENTNVIPEASSEAVFILSSIGKCLEMSPNDHRILSSPAAIHAWDCLVGAPHQKWIYSENNEIISTNGFCLSTGDKFDDFYINVIAEPCDGTEHQKWEFNPLTSVVINRAIPEMCLDIWNNNIQVNGRSVQLTDCYSEANQRWVASKLQVSLISSVLDKNLYISLASSNNSTVSLAVREGSVGESAQWVVQPSDDFVRIRSNWKLSQFLYFQNGRLKFGEIDVFGMNSKWSFVSASSFGVNVYQIQNTLDASIFIGLDENHLLKASRVGDLTTGSTYWKFSSVNVAE